jgi:hypothetical protein
LQSGRTVGLAFAWAILVFVATHVPKYPGTVRYVVEQANGEKILDMQPSFDADDTYRRLDNMGETGRAAYRRMIYTVDLVFPLSVFVALFLAARAAGQRLKKPLGAVLLALPIIYVAADFLENAAVLAMLEHLPERYDTLAANIGFVTRAKRVAMLAALVAPLTVLIPRLRASAVLLLLVACAGAPTDSPPESPPTGDCTSVMPNAGTAESAGDAGCPDGMARVDAFRCCADPS